MTESVGSNPIDGRPAGAAKPYTQADVFKHEYDALHGDKKDKKDKKDESTKQTPLADPSLEPPLEPTDDRARQRPTHAESDKTPSQQQDSDGDAHTLRTVWQNVHDLPDDGRTALCLSGGGVRSAAFNLGVLQGLARLKLLDRFHYLSTVSGGGYIGCWLSAWRYRCGISDVLSGLSWPDRIDANAEVAPYVPSAISNLRRSTNYLTPAKGILSPDTWATIVIVSRNLILNHVVIVPLVAALLLIVKLVGAVSHEQTAFALWKDWNHFLTDNSFQDFVWARYLGTFLVPGVCAAFGWITFSIARPSWDVRPAPNPKSKDDDPKSKDDDMVHGLFVRPWQALRDSPPEIWAPRLGIALVLLGASIFGFIVAKDIPTDSSSWSWKRFWVFPIGGAFGSLVGFMFAVGAATVKRQVAKGLLPFLGYVPPVPPGPVTVPTAGVLAVLLLTAAAAVAGGAGGLVLGAGEELAASLPKNNPSSTALLISIAPLWFVISYNAGDAVFLGLTARRPSVEGQWSDEWGDEEREWIARTDGYLAVIAAGISILFLLTLFSPILIDFVTSFKWTGPFGIAILGILSALASIGLAASPFSTHFGTAPRGVRLPVRRTLAVATPIFAGLLTAFLSTAIDKVLFNKPLLQFLSEPDVSVHWFVPTIPSGQRYLFGLAILLAVFSYGAARFVNINRFSLYDLYRMRLTSEFLGASNSRRKPEVWTGFDETDDIPLAKLWPPRKDEPNCLYPVINAALNMAATKRLEWQERKAVSFVLTPLYCGSGATRQLGFRETKDYAAEIKLGWAMSVSGAAVSPNAGYSTMPGLALLMTLFNLRLGVWSGNPGEAGGESYRQRGPDNALRPLLSEAFALTDDKSKYVYLSDGGHFDNLGVYEMLRRRCKFIVVSDATSDPYYAYADLGSVVRKAAIDLGIRITFEHLDMARPGETAMKGAYSAFGRIEYPEEESKGQRRTGSLLYIKPYIGGLNEPADVRAYSIANPAFPHDTTLNQFFGETQFESYRALGCYAVMELGRQAGFHTRTEHKRPKSLTEFFDGAQFWLARPRSGEEV